MFPFAAQGIILATVIGGISYGLKVAGIFRPSSPIIHTESGPVRGYIAVSRDGRGYAAYVGIPFAIPPVGNLRFEAPVPIEPWDAVFEADRYAPDCYHFDAMVKGIYTGSEDCLYLNVFTPKQPNTEALLPVMIWVHGGGFMSGGAKMYSPKYLMTENVIVVSMNYRLGPLGFLNTGDEKIRGNMGLKDQNLAIKWVKKNIENFGGNPNMITIFGESAGAASVHYHMISPASRNLFQKAILQSGGTFSPWSFTNNPKKQANEYAKKMKCPTDNTDNMVHCLKHKNAKDLVLPIVDLMTYAPFTGQESMFAPSMEAVQRDDTFLSENPRIAVEEGRFAKIPVIMGVTSGEGALRTARIEASGKSLNEIDAKWNEYCPMVLMYDPKRTDVSEKIRKYYFSDKPFAADPDEFLRKFSAMMSDGWFYQAIHSAANYHSREAPVYLYFYDYDAYLPGIYSTMKAVNPDDWLLAEIKVAISIAKDWIKKFFGYHGPHEFGAVHADDLLQVWYMEWLFEITTRSGDYKFSKDFVKVLTDFATNENSLKFNGKIWPPTNSESKEPFLYMRLDKDGEVIKEPFAKRLPFWNSLNIRNWRDPYP